MHIDVSVGEKIRHFREDKKITQQELAKRAGITPAAVCQWETKGTVPRAKTLAKVAQALGVSQHYLSKSKSGSNEAPISVSEHIENLKTTIAEAIGVETSRVHVNVTIEDRAPSQLES